MWTNGDIDALLEEGKCIQKHLRNAYPAKTNETIARKFRDLMLQGKVQSALRYLSQNTNGGVLKLEDLILETTQDGETIQRSTKDILIEKHPHGMDPDASCLLEDEPEMANPITFEGLDAEAIKKAALHTHGAAGPSGLGCICLETIVLLVQSCLDQLL